MENAPADYFRLALGKDGTRGNPVRLRYAYVIRATGLPVRITSADRSNRKREPEERMTGRAALGPEQDASLWVATAPSAPECPTLQAGSRARPRKS